ncbi:IclR family transcriptional regulator [Leucobacter ruminantium]|uniref:IclR family transcriptional regulator n=1 Tax=Leucobacter ruminantium TaxID=1289170 RepID=A0A939LUC0_9MICO|nr:IclR family transcriptional regulator [Leucobacter ruminantium]MBO1804974.1 IclR family transcriptional regulator [Leucobacter ruminantium]
MPHALESAPSVAAAGRKNSAGLGRDIELLELLAGEASARAGGMGVTELARLTGRSKTVVSRALSTLAAAGLASRDPDSGRYAVGPRIFALAARTAEAQLVRLGRPVLRGLVRATHETSHLCVLAHGNVLTLASELSPHELRSAGWEGVTTAAWRTSSGRVLVSEWDEGSLRAWYDEHGRDETVIGREAFDRESNPFFLLETPPSADARVLDYDSLWEEVGRIRRNGYAVIEGEFEAGVIGVSSPVHDHTGRIVAALNVSGPQERLGERVDALATIVRQAGAALSRSLGAGASSAAPSTG